MRWIVVCAVAFLVGCSSSVNREISISAIPPGTLINIDGINRGPAPITGEKLHFDDEKSLHRIVASRAGYADKTIELGSSYTQPDLLIQLEPLRKTVMIHVGPLPAMLFIDGKPFGGEPVTDARVDLTFGGTGKEPITHTLQASRPGFQMAERVAHWDDQPASYQLSLSLQRKIISISTNPPGATVFLDGKTLGPSPVLQKEVVINVDGAGNYVPMKVVVTKPGYEPVERQISWDEGRQQYQVDLTPRSKTVRVLTTPAEATVRLNDQDITSDRTGLATATLSFPPIDESGTLKTYLATISKVNEEAPWVPQQLKIAWDDGKTDYTVALMPAKMRNLSLLTPKIERAASLGWRIEPQVVQTQAALDVAEPSAGPQPERITSLPKGTMIDSLSISPDGQWLLFTTLIGNSSDTFKSQMQMVKTDGSGQTVLLGDGRFLDLCPAFTPDGAKVVFSSKRGNHLNIWQMATSGEGLPIPLTAGDTVDLSPTVDSDPKPRLYYECRFDNRPDPRLYRTEIGTSSRTDIYKFGGMRPRVSPRGDGIVFTSFNSKTGRREIFKISDQGDNPVDLTNDPLFDNFDPAWSKDGNKLAFVSDRGVDAEGHHNCDIYLLDLSDPDKPRQITSNASQDDSPALDPGGKYVYFRSNRGGEWAVWRMEIK